MEDGPPFLTMTVVSAGLTTTDVICTGDSALLVAAAMIVGATRVAMAWGELALGPPVQATNTNRVPPLTRRGTVERRMLAYAAARGAHHVLKSPLRNRTAPER